MHPAGKATRRRNIGVKSLGCSNRAGHGMIRERAKVCSPGFGEQYANWNGCVLLADRCQHFE